MKPAQFDYIRVETAQEAVEALSHSPDARILAGGQSLMAVMNMRLAQPSLLVDISRSKALNQISEDANWLRVDAATTQAQVEWMPGLFEKVPLLAQAFPFISHFQIRNRGTVCGSVAHADPSAEIPLVLVALKGEVILRGPRKKRVVSAEDFFQGMLSTARTPDEIVEAVRFPKKKAGHGYAFTEFSQRHGDFAACSVAAVVHSKGVRLAVGGVADRPLAREWAVLSAVDLDDALNDFSWQLQARDDSQVSALARRHMVRNLGKKIIAQAYKQREQDNAGEIN